MSTGTDVLASGANSHSELPRLKQRAPRFVVRVLVRYRELGDRDWKTGVTENISRSGVLFRVPKAAEVRSILEMMIVLPGDEADSEVRAVCLGHVVRHEPKTGARLSAGRESGGREDAADEREPSPSTALAATLSTYRLLGNPGRRQARLFWDAVTTEEAV